MFPNISYTKIRNLNSTFLLSDLKIFPINLRVKPGNENTFLRLLTECFNLVGSAIFGATFNLVTHVGLQKLLKHWQIVVCKLKVSIKQLFQNILQNGVNALLKMVFKNLIFVIDIKILYISDPTIWFKYRRYAVLIRIK